MALVLPFTPVGTWMGFHPPPAAALAAIALVVVVYLGCAELLKGWAIKVPAEILQRRP
ncbi:MAG: hypothetical protein WDM92_01905 [Caulobacteraceae bacterium]